MAAVPDPGSRPLRVLLRRYRWSLVGTYGVTAVENTFDLLYPFAIGLGRGGDRCRADEVGRAQGRRHHQLPPPLTDPS